MIPQAWPSNRVFSISDNFVSFFQRYIITLNDKKDEAHYGTADASVDLCMYVRACINPFSTEPLAVFLLLEKDNLGIIH